MNNKLLLLLVLGIGWSNAETKPESVPLTVEQSYLRTAEEAGIMEGRNAFDPPEIEHPKLAQVQVEFVELSHESLTKLLFLRSPKSTDATDLRKQVQDLVSKKEAKVLETQILVCQSGHKATTESTHEFIYPTEYKSSNVPMPDDELSKKEVAKFAYNPAIPSTFNTRNVGSCLEIEPSIGKDNRIIYLRFVPEFTWHTGNTVWSEGKETSRNPFKVSTPDFYSIRINTSIICIDGQYNFAGALSPKNDKGEVDTTRKLMVFVKCDVLSVK